MRTGANPEDLKIIKRAIDDGMTPEEISQDIKLNLDVVVSLAEYFGYSKKKKTKTKE